MMNITEVVTGYLKAFPEDASVLTELQLQLSANDKLIGNDNFNGHVTVGALIFSPDSSKVLMIHHNVIKRWLQPGGHWDEGEADTLLAARREAEEETGITIASYIPFDANNKLIPVHIETHTIPERPARNQPAHNHHDFRYVFIAANETVRHQASEVSAATWFELDSPETAELAVALTRARLLLNS